MPHTSPVPNPGRLSLALLVALALPAPLPGQAPEAPPPWVGQAGVASANALAGALTAAVVAWMRGEEVPRAFLRGAAGGAVVFAGKRVAVERFDGAGFLGREIAAVGTSVVANAGAGRDWIDEVWLPLGPVWLRTGRAAPVGVRVNLRDVGVLAWAATRPELRFDAAASLSNGTAFFRADRHQIRYQGRYFIGGVALGTTVLLAKQSLWDESTAGHELIHVIQDDFVVHAWSRPLEKWGWLHLTGWNPPIDIALASAIRLLDPARDVEEYEAEALSRR